ncbi:MAG: biotin transporter BioY, partial [Nitrososphaerales archaeon]
AILAALTAATGGISIPLPFTPVPITLQVFFVYLAGCLAGPIYGALSMLLYLTIGALGLPVFSRFGAGLGHIIGPTGGYLLAFPIAALVNGLITFNRSKSLQSEYGKVLCGMLLSLVVIYLIGVSWLSTYLHKPFVETFLIGGLPFIPVDLLKMVVAAPIAVRLRKDLASILR